MIVITTPTGMIGRQVLDRVLEADESVRVIVRDASRLAPAALERVEVIEGSHGDAKVVDRAFTGADSVFWLAPPNRPPHAGRGLMDFARPPPRRSFATASSGWSASRRSAAASATTRDW